MGEKGKLGTARERGTDETRDADNVDLARQGDGTREADRDIEVETESERPGN